MAASDDAVGVSRKKYTVYQNPGEITSRPGPKIDNRQPMQPRPPPTTLVTESAPLYSAADALAVVPFVAVALLVNWRQEVMAEREATKLAAAKTAATVPPPPVVPTPAPSPVAAKKSAVLTPKQPLPATGSTAASAFKAQASTPALQRVEVTPPPDPPAPEETAVAKAEEEDDEAAETKPLLSRTVVRIAIGVFLAVLVGGIANLPGRVFM